MKHLSIVIVILACWVSLAHSQTLQGTVTNGTTSKPAAGVDVTLIKLASGMTEAAHTKTDSQGRFTLDLGGDTAMPHLVRATHQGVNYFKMAPPGTNTADVQIYDAAKKLEGIATTVQIMRLQSDGNGLQVIELYAVQNSSTPPRTLMADRNFEIALPPDAKIEEASARSPNGQPVNTVPVPVDTKKGQYYFGFPLRPGETQFQVAYRLPYSGQAQIKPTLLHDVQHFVAVLPKAMQFSPTSGTRFAPMPDDSGSNVQVVTNAKAGDELGFTVSGTGILSDQTAVNSGGSEAAGGDQQAMQGPRGPGGGIGNPIGSPDPLSQYRWPLLGILTAVLIVGGLYMVRRAPESANDNAALAAAPADDDSATTAGPVTDMPGGISIPRTAQIKPASSLLLEALKEELFQLEMERQESKISQEEYEKAKTALDQTLKRALSRKSR